YLQAQMKSERGRFAMLAHTWLALDPVFLDTETTGLDAGARWLFSMLSLIRVF
ncbi:hypothetical protein LTSERUB_0836, partial [Salmonella enterica subsp. enterica serovar Rubislaw str. A4-653]